MLVKDLSNQDLIEEYKYAIRWWHYDPHGAREPKFSVDTLEKELLERLSHE